MNTNIRKNIYDQRPSNTEQINRVQNIPIKVWKQRAVECLEI